MLCSLKAMTVHLSSYSFVDSVLVTMENVDARSSRDFLVNQYTLNMSSEVFLPSVFTVTRLSYTGGSRGSKSSHACETAYTSAPQKGDSEAIPLKCRVVER